MPITFQQLQAKLPWTTLDPKEWHQHTNGGGWVHQDAKIMKPKIEISGDAVISGGVIWGGEIWGGVISGGMISGDAVIWGGEIRGGEISGGVIRGGVIRGGEIRGGEISGGEWTFSPLQIQGSKHFVVTGSHTHIAIGCQNHTISEWQNNFQKIGIDNDYTSDQITEYGLFIALCAEWLKSKFPSENKGKPTRDARGRFSKK